MAFKDSSISCHGFTLLELLITITIICVLASLSIVWWKSTKERVESVQTVSNLRQIVVALSIYAADHNNNLPPRTYFTNDASGAEQVNVDESLLFLTLFNESYITDPRVFVSPTNMRCHAPFVVNRFGPGKDLYFSSNNYVTAEWWRKGDGFPATPTRLTDDLNVPVAWDTRADQFYPLNFVKGPQGQYAGHFAYMDGSVKLLWPPMSLLSGK